MTPRSLAAILLKCMAFSLGLQALGLLSAAVQFLGSYGTPAGGIDPRVVFAVQATYAVMLLAVSLLFLVNTDLVLRLFFRDLEAPVDEPAIPGTPFAWFAMALGVLGAWVLSRAIPLVTSQAAAFALLLPRERRLDLLEWWSRNWNSEIYDLALFAVGLVLFLASRRVAAFWYARQPIRDRGEREAHPPA